MGRSPTRLRAFGPGLLLLSAACGASSGGGPAAAYDAGAADSTGPAGDASTADAQGGDGGADAAVPPTIVVTSPATDAGIPTLAAALDPSGRAVVAIGFATTSFTLAPLGGCGSAARNATDDGCGHVEVFVDGASCTLDGGVDNADAFASPAQVVVGDCPMVKGTHSALLELHHADRSPIVDPSTGTTIGVSLTFTVSGP